MPPLRPTDQSSKFYTPTFQLVNLNLRNKETIELPRVGLFFFPLLPLSRTLSVATRWFCRAAE